MAKTHERCLNKAVIVNPKGELTAKVHGTLTSHGYKVVQLNLIDAKKRKKR